MAIIPIRRAGDPVLREKARRVRTIDSSIHKLIDDMWDTMYDAPGVGLAAPQVNISRRFIVVDAGNRTKEGEEQRAPLCLINPEIVDRGDEMSSYEEGCLSLPDVTVDIARPTSIKVRYIDRDGAEQELDAEGFLATVIQHEVDHLDGRLIIDYLSSLKRDVIVRRFKKLARQNA